MLSNAKTAAEIETAIRSRIAHGEILLQVSGIIRETARKMDGHKVTKRFATAVANRVRELMGAAWTVHWSNDGFGSKVAVWGPEVPYNDRLVYAVGRDGPYMRNTINTISEAWIVQENPAYFDAEAARLNLFREALDKGKAAEWAASIAEIARVKKALGEDAASYGLHYYLDVP